MNEHRSHCTRLNITALFVIIGIVLLLTLNFYCCAENLVLHGAVQTWRLAWAVRPRDLERFKRIEFFFNFFQDSQGQQMKTRAYQMSVKPLVSFWSGSWNPNNTRPQPVLSYWQRERESVEQGCLPFQIKALTLLALSQQSFSTQRGEHESTPRIIIQTCPANTRAGRDACSVLRTSPDELSVTFPSAPHSLSHSVPGQRGPAHPHIVVQSGGKVYPQRSLHASDLHTFLCAQLFSSRPKCVPWNKTFLIIMACRG